MKIQSTAGIASIALLAASVVFPLTAAFAGQPSFGNLYYNGTIVRTVVPPSATDVALDNFYKVTNGASGQLGVAAVAPGNPDYHGGHWKVFLVTFSSGVTPFLLTSEAAVLAAQAAAQVTVTRAQAMDFLCPIQP
jgi:hypothetical protein